MDFKYLLSRLYQKLGFGLILIVITSIHLLIIIGNFSIIKYAILKIEDDSILVNKVGKIRGGSQKILLLNLQNIESKNNSEIIHTKNQIDEVFNEFLIEEKYKKIGREMYYFIEELESLESKWIFFKDLLERYNTSKSKEKEELLFEYSEKIWQKGEDILNVITSTASKKTFILRLIYIVFAIDFLLILFIIFLVNKQVRNKLEHLSTKDSLTNIYNRHSYNERLKTELRSCERKQDIFAYMLFDIDFFKQINDDFGHNIGDEVLIKLSSLISNTIRMSDDIYRIGGEEFVIIAKDLDKKTIVSFANKLRKSVKNFDFGLSRSITVSFGITLYQKGDSEDSIFKRADKALYISKTTGRNKVTLL